MRSTPLSISNSGALQLTISIKVTGTLSLVSEYYDIPVCIVHMATQYSTSVVIYMPTLYSTVCGTLEVLTPHRVLLKYTLPYNPLQLSERT